jgi:hypothetical protein
MTRILLILSLVLVLVSAWFIYSQGILTQVLNPTVVALRAENDVALSQRIRPNMVATLQVPVADLAPGTLVFNRDVTADQIAEVLGQGRALSRMAKGDLLGSRNFGKAPDTWQLRTMAAFQSGDPVDSGALEAFVTETPQEGALTFPSRVTAEGFVNERDSLRAARVLEPGRVLSLDDLASGDGGVVFVLETVRDLSNGDSLTPADVRASTVSATDIPRGAIAFPSRSGADIFVTASQSLTLTYDVPAGTTLVADMVKPGSGRLSDTELDPSATRPGTLQDLLTLQEQFPFEVKTINLVGGRANLDVAPSVVLIGSRPVEGDKMDLWVEVSATTGPFASVTLRRFVKGVEIHKVVDPELVISARTRAEEVAGEERSGATPPPNLEEEETPEARGIFYWANMTRPGGLAIEEAKEEERLVFVMSANTPVSDFLGNGVLCREDTCTVSVSATDDLRIVRDAIERFGRLEEQAVEEVVPPAPFSIMDGVSKDLEAQMHAENYLTFEDVALWEDAQLQLLEFQLGISRTLALYIREQARTIVNTPNLARQELGIASAPTE